MAVLGMKVLVYSTDLSEHEWRKARRFLPPAKHGGRPRKRPRGLICDAIFYLVRAGCAWHLLPRNFPPWKTVCDYFRTWRLAGVWLRLHGRLCSLCRRRAGRSARPTAAIIDSQSAKATSRGGMHGYDGGKKGRRPQAPPARRYLRPRALCAGPCRLHRRPRRRATALGSGGGTLRQTPDILQFARHTLLDVLKAYPDYSGCSHGALSPCPLRHLDTATERRGYNQKKRLTG